MFRIPGRTVGVVVTAVALSVVALQAARANGAPPSNALLPDLQTVVPLHLQLVNAHQQEIIRFSNGIANTGAGHLRLRPELPAAGGTVQSAVQELLDAQGTSVWSGVVSQFDFHPDHNHWHIDAVARFSIHEGSPDGKLVASAEKVTFCLIDWYKLDGPSRNVDRAYSECNAGYQGISPGWVDQYHQSTTGQQLEITGQPPGIYVLVSTSNPTGSLIESDYANNTAWTEFELRRDSKGNPRIIVTRTSACDTPALCGVKAPNR